MLICGVIIIVKVDKPFINFLRRCKYKRGVKHIEISNVNSAISELTDFFLGKDWYTSMPIGHEQIITEIVYEIETKYKKLKAK